MGRRTAVAAGALVAGAALLVPAMPAAAKTTVTVKGDDVTITVPIDCAGCKGRKGPDGTPLADYWAKTATKAWNDAFATHPYCSRYLFHVKVDITPRGEGFRGKDGDHLIQVSTGNPNGRLIPPPGFEGHNSGAYDQDFDGSWDEQLPDVGVDHEVGHLLGLSDDYTVVSKQPRVTKPKDGRAGTMMADGGQIDPTLIDRIGKQLEKRGDIDKCKKQTWQGTMRVDQTIGRAPNPPCVLSYTADVTLAVQGRDATGAASVHGSPNPCGFAVASTAALPVRRTGDGFEIDAGQFTYGAPGTAEVKESGHDRAHGTLTTQYPLPAGREITYDLTFDLACKSCGKAVG